MADKLCGSVRAVMQAQRHIAPAASDDFAALAALDCGREGTSLAKEQDLPLPCEAISDQGNQLPGEKADHSPLSPLGDGVDDLDIGWQGSEIPLFQGDIAKTSNLAVIQGFEGRSGRTEDDAGRMDHAEHHGCFPCIVARRGRILLVRSVMFFVNDNQAQIPVRQEYGGTGTEHQVGSASHGFCRFIPGELALGGMEDQKARPDGSPHSLLQLAAQGDFRHKIQDAAPRPKAFGSESEVYLSLPGASNPVKQDRFPRRHQFPDFIQSLQLGFREFGQNRGKAVQFLPSFIRSGEGRQDAREFLLMASDLCKQPAAGLIKRDLDRVLASTGKGGFLGGKAHAELFQFAFQAGFFFLKP